MAYGMEDLQQVEVFKCLGRLISHVNNSVPAIWRSLQRAHSIWRHFFEVLVTKEVPTPMAGMFYQAVAAAVLLYGSELFSLSLYALKVMEGFHMETA